jgi:hypothetical protein
MEIQITEGWTGNIDMQLLADGVAVDLTGVTVALVLTGRDAVAVDTTGDVAVFEAATGKIRWNPDAADLAVTKSPYRIRAKVTDAVSKIVFFPSGPGGRVVVHRS